MKGHSIGIHIHNISIAQFWMQFNDGVIKFNFVMALQQERERESDGA